MKLRQLLLFCLCFAVADIGQNANLYAGAGSTVTGNSQHSLNLSDMGTTATLYHLRLSVVQQED